MTADYCPKGHPTLTSAARDPNGTCKQCRKDCDRALKARQRAAYVVCRGLEGLGVRYENNGQPVPTKEIVRQLMDGRGLGSVDRRP